MTQVWPFHKTDPNVKVAIKHLNKRPTPARKQSIMLYAEDDLVTRAEKIVWILGHRGAVGNFVLEVHRMLKKYEELGQKAASMKKGD
jgi:hypothetical protein